MTNALVFDVPVELSLELVPIVRPRLPDAEREAFDDVADAQDGIGLSVPVVDLQRSDAGGIVNGGILEAFDRFSIFSRKNQELDVDLDLVARKAAENTNHLDRYGYRTLGKAQD